MHQQVGPITKQTIAEPTVLKDHFEFFRQFRQHFETTGAIAPSSRFLAKAMTKPLRDCERRPVRVLEIGPGTGAVTGHIVKALQPDDRFDLVELNQAFVDLLTQRFKTHADYSRVAENSQIHMCPVQEFQFDEPYDFVISGLPLNNFPAELVDEIFDVYFKLLSPSGVLSYFEYMYVRTLRKRIGKKPERARLKHIDDTMRSYCERHRIKRDSIWLNMPSAWVQHLQKPA